MTTVDYMDESRRRIQQEQQVSASWAVLARALEDLANEIAPHCRSRRSGARSTKVQ